jgi:catechol 2,3-dioxygenase-like lactoylglutathione lyase family enzyme
MTPKIYCERHHPVLSVPDINSAVTFYTEKLGFTPGFLWDDPPTFAGVNLGDISIHFSQGNPSPGGAGISFVVGNADELFKFHQANGIEIIEPIANRPYELRDYSIKDLNGYRLSFGHYIYSEPPLQIERVNLTIRIEKRLAALLQDLAAHKDMTIGNCLEETLLHTFEKMGNGVASPHTRGTHDFIDELKKKHGIDYDVHASYRFRE